MDFLHIKNERRNALIAEQAELRSQRDAKQAELDQFASTLDTEKRSANTDEDALCALALDELRSLGDAADAKQAEIDQIDADIAALERTAQDRKNVPNVIRGKGKTSRDDVYDISLRSAPRTDESRRDIRDRALRAIDLDDRLTDEQRGVVEAKLRNPSINHNGALDRHILTTGRDAYRSAFGKLMRDAKVFTEAEGEALEELRAINIATDSEGGYLMPFTLDPSIILVNDGRTNPMRQLATVRTVVTDNWQGVTSAGVTASWDGEGTEVSDDSPTFAQPAIPVKGARVFIEYTAEAEDDFDGLATDATVMINDAFDDLEAAAFATGAGTGNVPQGIVTGLLAVASNASRVQTAGVGAYALADVDSLSDAVPDRYDASAVFLMHRAIVTATRNLGDATGDPVTHLASGGPMQLRNRDVYKYSKLDSAVSTGNEIAVCGDIRSAYRINDRLGVTVERVPMLFDTANNLPNGKRGWYARKRLGAGVVDGNAARVLQVQ